MRQRYPNFYTLNEIAIRAVTGQSSDPQTVENLIEQIHSQSDDPCNLVEDSKNLPKQTLEHKIDSVALEKELRTRKNSKALWQEVLNKNNKKVEELLLASRDKKIDLDVNWTYQKKTILDIAYEQRSYPCILLLAFCGATRENGSDLINDLDTGYRENGFAGVVSFFLSHYNDPDTKAFIPDLVQFIQTRIKLVYESTVVGSHNADESYINSLDFLHLAFFCIHIDVILPSIQKSTITSQTTEWKELLQEALIEKKLGSVVSAIFVSRQTLHDVSKDQQTVRAIVEAVMVHPSDTDVPDECSKLGLFVLIAILHQNPGSVMWILDTLKNNLLLPHAEVTNAKYRSYVTAVLEKFKERIDHPTCPKSITKEFTITNHEYTEALCAVSRKHEKVEFSYLIDYFWLLQATPTIISIDPSIVEECSQIASRLTLMKKEILNGRVENYCDTWQKLGPETFILLTRLDLAIKGDILAINKVASVLFLLFPNDTDKPQHNVLTTLLTACGTKTAFSPLKKKSPKLAQAVHQTILSSAKKWHVQEGHVHTLVDKILNNPKIKIGKVISLLQDPQELITLLINEEDKQNTQLAQQEYETVEKLEHDVAEKLIDMRNAFSLMIKSQKECEQLRETFDLSHKRLVTEKKIATQNEQIFLEMLKEKEAFERILKEERKSVLDFSEKHDHMAVMSCVERQLKHLQELISKFSTMNIKFTTEYNLFDAARKTALRVKELKNSKQAKRDDQHAAEQERQRKKQQLEEQREDDNFYRQLAQLRRDVKALQQRGAKEEKRLQQEQLSKERALQHSPSNIIEAPERVMLSEEFLTALKNPSTAERLKHVIVVVNDHRMFTDETRFAYTLDIILAIRSLKGHHPQYPAMSKISNHLIHQFRRLGFTGETKGNDDQLLLILGRKLIEVLPHSQEYEVDFSGLGINTPKELDTSNDRKILTGLVDQCYEWLRPIPSKNQKILFMNQSLSFQCCLAFIGELLDTNPDIVPLQQSRDPFIKHRHAICHGEKVEFQFGMIVALQGLSKKLGIKENRGMLPS